MNIDVRLLGVPASSLLQDFVRRKLAQHLGRLRVPPSEIEVRIKDDNGPKGGVDKRCVVLARGTGVGRAQVEVRSRNAYVAAGRAIAQLGRLLRRGLRRLRGRRALDAVTEQPARRRKTLRIFNLRSS